jgi:hypothetical protein
MVLGCSSVYAQFTEEISNWKNTWPRLKELKLGDTTLYIDPSLVVDTKSGTDKNGEVQYGTIHLGDKSHQFRLKVEHWYNFMNIDLESLEDENKVYGIGKVACIPNNGSIYSVQQSWIQGRITVLKKFSVTQDSVTEVKQAFYSVSLDSKTGFEFGLYRSQTEDERVATVATGSQVHILGLSSDDNDWFLIKTSSGLVGWTKLIEKTEQRPIEGSDRSYPFSKYSLSILDGVYR